MRTNEQDEARTARQEQKSASRMKEPSERPPPPLDERTKQELRWKKAETVNAEPSATLEEKEAWASVEQEEAASCPQKPKEPLGTGGRGQRPLWR